MGLANAVAAHASAFISNNKASLSEVARAAAGKVARDVIASQAGAPTGAQVEQATREANAAGGGRTAAQPASSRMIWMVAGGIGFVVVVLVVVLVARRQGG